MPKLLTQGVSLEPKNGRQLIGIVAGFKSERWPVIDRNAGRLQLGIRNLTYAISVCATDSPRRPRRSTGGGWLSWHDGGTGGDAGRT